MRILTLAAVAAFAVAGMAHAQAITTGDLAALDTDLRLGTLVSPVTLHRAGVLAKQAATLDVLSGGRAFCGVGAGWFAREQGIG